jgi:hypothetical protein
MLLQLHRKTTSAAIDEFDFKKILDDLKNDGFPGALSSLQEKAGVLFGVPRDLVSPQKIRLMGDLFFVEPDKLLYLKCRRKGGETTSADPFSDPGAFDPEVSIECGIIAPVGSAIDELETFVTDVSTILEVEFNIDTIVWTEPGAGTESLGDLGDAVVPPSQADRDLAAVLREPKLTQFLAALQTQKGELILDDWLAERDDADEVEYFIDKLTEADFFVEEVVVYSTETGKPIIRAKDRAGLETLKAAGVRDVNGEDLDLENVRRMLILPKDKRPTIQKSWVGRVALLDMLAKMGVAGDHIVEVDALDDDVVLAAVLDGAAYMFVLANDGVEPQTFADIAGTIKKLGKPTVVAVTDKDVDCDAAKAAGAAECLVLGGVDEFSTKLLDQLATDRRAAIAEIVAEFDKMHLFNFSAMAMTRFTDDD